MNIYERIRGFIDYFSTLSERAEAHGHVSHDMFSSPTEQTSTRQTPSTRTSINYETSSILSARDANFMFGRTGHKR